MANIHKTQEKLYHILQNPEKDGLSMREIASEIGVSSPNTVSHHMKQLEKKGYIFRNRKTGRIDVLKDPVRELVFLNMYGLAECGPQGLFTEGNIVDRVPLPSKTFRVSNESFLVEASGDSMYPMIEDGDLVLAEKSSDPDDGDIVVVIHNEGAKIKKLFKKNDEVILTSINPAYPPMSAYLTDQLTVCGIVTGIVRKFD